MDTEKNASQNHHLAQVYRTNLRKRSGQTHLINKARKTFRKRAAIFSANYKRTVQEAKSTVHKTNHTVYILKCNVRKVPSIKRTESNRATDVVARFRVCTFLCAVWIIIE